VGPRTGLNGRGKSYPHQAGASPSRSTVHLLRVVMCATGLSSCLCGSIYSASQLVNVSIQANIYIYIYVCVCVCVCVCEQQNAIHIHFCLVPCQPASPGRTVRQGKVRCINSEPPNTRSTNRVMFINSC